MAILRRYLLTRSRFPICVKNWDYNPRFLSCRNSFSIRVAAFQTMERPRRQAEEKQKRIEFLEKKVQTKDEVLAELMAEHIALEKSLGEL